jgi:hypothetical protein
MRGIDFSTLYIGSPLNNTGGKLVALHGELVAAQGAGGGTAVLNAGGTIEFGGPTTTAVSFADSEFNSAALVLDDSVHFKGVISGFAKANTFDQIDLADIDPATATKSSFSAGVLTIKDGSGHTAQLHFSGAYTLSSFTLNPDGDGGTLLTDPPVAPHAPAAAPPANAALFGAYIASAFPSTASIQSAALDLLHPAAVPLLAPAHG